MPEGAVEGDRKREGAFGTKYLMKASAENFTASLFEYAAGVQRQDLDSVIPVDPFQFELSYDIL